MDGVSGCGDESYWTAIESIERGCELAASAGKGSGLCGLRCGEVCGGSLRGVWGELGESRGSLGELGGRLVAWKEFQMEFGEMGRSAG